MTVVAGDVCLVGIAAGVDLLNDPVGEREAAGDGGRVALGELVATPYGPVHAFVESAAEGLGPLLALRAEGQPLGWCRSCRRLLGRDDLSRGIASGAEWAAGDAVEDDVELAGVLVDHDLLDEDQHQLLALGGVEGGPRLVEDVEDADGLRDLLGGPLERLHLTVELGDAGVHGLELSLDNTNTLYKKIVRAAAGFVA